tara:strand:+ start:322 stop:654 length:333 start_codon:yes stop_codon:yes gene_type:complete
MLDYDKLSVRILEPFRQTDFLIWHSLDNKIATFWGFRKQNTDTFTDSPPPFEANLICGQKDERTFFLLKINLRFGDFPFHSRLQASLRNIQGKRASDRNEKFMPFHESVA